MQNKKKSIFITTFLILTGLGILLGSVAVIQYEQPPAPTPLIQGATTDIADPALPAIMESPNEENKLPTQSTIKSVPKIGCVGTFTQEFMCLLNQYRASKGKSKLTHNASISNVATSYSLWMKNTDSFSHTGPNGSHFAERCKAEGLTCSGENLAKGFSSPKNLLDMWKASPGHNENLLRNFSAAGLGVQGSYATLLFK